MSYQINKFSLKTFFDVLQVKLAFSSMSRVYELEENKKCQGSLIIIIMTLFKEDTQLVKTSLP